MAGVSRSPESGKRTRFFRQAENAAGRILEAFQAGSVPKALAPVFVRRKDDVPCRAWSWSNQLLVALAGHSDARGYRQWQQVGRHVRKGEKGFHILVPMVGKKTVEDLSTWAHELVHAADDRLLELWLKCREGLGLSGRHPVFCTLRGGPLSTSYCRGLFTRLGQRAGIEKRVHPHGLRHTGAAELRVEGTDIAVIARQLGHASIATTSRYLDHIVPTAVVTTMRKREWAAG